MLASPPGDLMPNFLESLLFLLVFLAAARGVGAALLKKLLPDLPFGHAFATAFGLGLWLAFGGLLNVAHLAIPLVLDLLLFVGFALSAISGFFWYRASRETNAAAKKPIPKAEVGQKFWLPLGVILWLAYLVSSQMPSLSLNLHDDFFAYLPRPIHMLETGTLSGNPFDVLGMDSLGGQAYLQSFFVHRLSLLHIHGFDAIACFGLSLGLLLEMAVRHRSSAGVTVASILAFLLIPPQTVNTSALFSGSLMMLGLVFSAEIGGDSLTLEDAKHSKAKRFLVAVFLSSLLTLKNSFLPLGVLFIGFWVLRLALLHADKRLVLKHLGVLFGFAVLLLAPWLGLHFPRYRDALRVAGAEGAALGEGASPSENLIMNVRTAFSLEESPWGGRLLIYSLLAVFLAVFGGILWRRSAQFEPTQRARLATTSAMCLSVAASYFINVYIVDPVNGIRYSIPFLLPAVAVALLSIPWLRSGEQDEARETRFGALLSAGVALALALSFGGAIQERFDRIVRQRTLLSFPLAGTKPYRQYILTSVGVQAANYVQRVQEQFEPGTTVLSWIRTPFLMDHQRNNIYHLNESSILNPWLADFPLAGKPDEVRAYLRRFGVRYVFFEHDARGMKTDDEFLEQAKSPYASLQRYGKRNLALRRVLTALSEHSQAMYKTPETVVFDIEKVVEPGAKEAGEKQSPGHDLRPTNP